MFILNRFDHIEAKGEVCGNSYEFNYFGDYSSDAEFFVAAGVLAMLYSLGSLGFYCFFGGNYQTNKTFPLVVIFFFFVELNEKKLLTRIIYLYLLGFSCNNGDCCFLAVRKCCLGIWSLCCEICLWSRFLDKNCLYEKCRLHFCIRWKFRRPQHINRTMKRNMQKKKGRKIIVFIFFYRYLDFWIFSFGL